MTSVSAGPTAPVPISAAEEKVLPAAAPGASKRRGVDYSKFDNIVDSDDEKPAKNETKAAQPAEPAERPHCHNCHKDIDKPLRCGICKKVSYCSPACQKDDWSYHKRVCRKPEAPKAEDKASPSKPPSASQEEDRQKKTRKAEEEKVVESEENLTWYRHRDWKPTEEAKKDFAPTQLSPTDTANSGEKHDPSAGSVWNTAGTWEDKDVTDLAKRTLRGELAGFASINVAGGELSAKDVEQVDGEASKPVIRGKMRHLFDLSFKVKFVFKWMDSNGQQKAAGTIEVNDFTNDAFLEDGGEGPAMEVTFKDKGMLDTNRRKAVEDAIGAHIWPPPGNSLMTHIVAKMRGWCEDYQQQT